MAQSLPCEVVRWRRGESVGCMGCGGARAWRLRAKMRLGSLEYMSNEGYHGHDGSD
jgi:hypothetical protein